MRLFKGRRQSDLAVSPAGSSSSADLAGRLTQSSEDSASSPGNEDKDTASEYHVVTALPAMILEDDVVREKEMKKGIVNCIQI